MTATRTHPKWTRPYVDGYALKAYVMTLGPLNVNFDFDQQAAIGEEIKGGLCGHATVTPTAIGGIFDTTQTTGLHAVMSGAGARTLLITNGVNAAPVAGDEAFCGVFEQTGYEATPPVNGMVTVNIPFDKNSATATALYANPWGVLLHAEGAETAVNTGTGVDDNGAATTAGGFMVYQLLSSNGTVTIKAQHAAINSNGSFSDITGATSGAVDASSTPKYGLVEVATTLSISRYLRWQIVLGTATTCTFVLAFVRGQ